MMIIDEIDASLHPLLTARLIGLFREPETNPHGAQLIFATHDASLLGTALGEEVLARGQIWFVEKDRSGADLAIGSPLTGSCSCAAGR
ncbi:MAG TPA: AAA family ATPase [Pseudonocardiaceae bacterium]